MISSVRVTSVFRSVCVFPLSSIVLFFCVHVNINIYIIDTHNTRFPPQQRTQPPSFLTHNVFCLLFLNVNTLDSAAIPILILFKTRRDETRQKHALTRSYPPPLNSVNLLSLGCTGFLAFPSPSFPPPFSSFSFSP